MIIKQQALYFIKYIVINAIIYQIKETNFRDIMTSENNTLFEK